MKAPKLTLSNIVFGILLVLLLIPKTRTFLQVNLQKVMIAVSSPSAISASDQKKLLTYQGEFSGVNTGDINLNALQNKVVLINFWATWCPPCIAEMPSMESLYESYKKEDVAFIFVTNEPKETILKFLQKHHYNFPVYIQNSPLPEAFKHSSIPTTFLLDKQGNIVIHKTGATDWNSKNMHEIMDNLLK